MYNLIIYEKETRGLVAQFTITGMQGEGIYPKNLGFLLVPIGTPVLRQNEDGSITVVIGENADVLEEKKEPVE